MTPTALANVALGHIGQARIADIGERSPAAEHCRRMFDHVRRLCLRDHDWNFAVRRSTLTALDAAPPFGYGVAYQLPTDCLRILSINGQPAGVRGANWEVEGRTVLCNAAYAHLRYIADAEDTEQWDDMFGGYFCYRLAAHIAPSFRLDPQSAIQLEQMAAALRASAQEADRVETAPMVTRLDQSEIIQERGGWASGTAYGTSNTTGSTIGWGSIAVAGQSTLVATVAGDTFTLVAGSNVTLTTNAAAKTITISASGGGGGSTSLTMTRTANAVTITPSGGGTAATIPQASDTAAGVLTAAHHAQLAALGTMSTQAAAAVAITGGSITGTTVSGVTLSGSSTPTLAVTGTAAVSGTNTGDQTITLTGDVTGSGTGSFAATIANNAVTTAKINAAAVTNAKLANASAFTIKANLTGSSAPPSDADLVDVASSLPVFGAAQRGMVPVTGAGTNARFLLANATWSDTLAFGTLTASDPFVITQTWNNGAVVFAGLEMTITQTAANSSSYFVRFRGGAAGATDRFSVQIDGTTTQAGGANWFSGSCGLSSGAGLFFNDGAARIQFGSTTGSPNLHRESDNALGLRNGTIAQTLRVNDTHGSTTDYHRVSIATVRASLSSLSGASVTSTGLIPAGAIVVGVTAKVLTAVTGASSWQLGTAADPDRFAASGGIALGSTTDNRNWTSGALECFLSATDIILTANGSNFTAGAVYISVQYIRGEAD